MEPPDVAKVNAENCYLNDDYKDIFSTKDNGACDKFIFDDSIMKSTIGKVFYVFGISYFTSTNLTLNLDDFIIKYQEK